MNKQCLPIGFQLLFSTADDAQVVQETPMLHYASYSITDKGKEYSLKGERNRYRLLISLPEKMNRDAFGALERMVIKQDDFLLDLLLKCDVWIPVFLMFERHSSRINQMTCLLTVFQELMKTYPRCIGLRLDDSQKTMSRHAILMAEDPAHFFVDFCLSIRMFPIVEKDEMIIDTLGFEIIGLLDLQYYCYKENAYTVKRHLRYVADQLVTNKLNLKEERKVPAFVRDEISNHSWDCILTTSLVHRYRDVYDIQCGNYMSSHKNLKVECPRW